MTSDDLFVTDEDGNIIERPKSSSYTPSQCTPLFFLAFKLRDAAACIHTHSPAAVLVTLLFENEFVITHQEMIKGLRIGSTKKNLRYFDTCVIPIIENTAEERDLADMMRRALVCNFRVDLGFRSHLLSLFLRSNTQIPMLCSCAVTASTFGVRRLLQRCFGTLRNLLTIRWLFCFSWEKAKTQCECIDYLLSMAVEMRKLGFKPEEVPATSPYINGDERMGDEGQRYVCRVLSDDEVHQIETTESDQMQRAKRAADAALVAQGRSCCPHH